MDDVDPVAVEPVAVEPDYCHRCGTALETVEFEGRDRKWCPECERVLSRNPVAGVQVVVHDDKSVLLLEERRTPDGDWNLPGGHAEPDEGPRTAALRELEEETGLRANPSDLSLLTVAHVERPNLSASYYSVTYALARGSTSGDLTTEDRASAAAFVPVKEVHSSPERTMESERDRIALAFDS